MKRVLPFFFVLSSGLAVYACSSSSSSDNPPAGDDAGGGGTDSGGGGDDSGGQDSGGQDSATDGPASDSPIDGIAAPTEITALTGHYTEGPVWKGDGLYFSEFAVNGHFIKLVPPATTSDVRAVATAGNEPLGSAFDVKANTFVTCEVKPGGGGEIVRTPAAGGAGTAIAISFDGGPGFDSPNDVIGRADGTLYITDPGYQATPTNNHLWRISPAGAAFETVLEGRPNGIALSPDQKTLYLSFTDPLTPPPYVNKYPVNADGTLGAGTKFADVAKDSAPDGIAVDTKGNVYVAVKNGVDVFKSDGTKWGHITTTKVINGLAFGGADKKTLFMTSDTGMLQVTVKVAGLSK